MSESVKLKYVHSYVDNRGRSRSYFRRGDQTTALAGVPGSAQFMAAYAAALTGTTGLVVPAPIVPKSFRDLAEQYFASGLFTTKAKSTQINYRRVIENDILKEHGHRDVALMKRVDVDKMIGGYKDKPGAGIVMFKRLSTLLKYAVSIDWIDRDPSRGCKFYKSEPFHTWTEAEIAQFEAYWPIGTAERLGFALCLYTAQRGSDVHTMTVGDIDGDLIFVMQQKTANRPNPTRIWVPIHPTLAAIIEATARERGKVREIDPAHACILLNAWGVGFTVKGFGQMMSDAIAKAGLPERCKTHGLRKAAATRLADAGCTTKQIMAITGHKSLSEVELYTEAADQKRNARAAIRKQVANEKVASRNSRVASMAPKGRKTGVSGG